jgi:hypothetical protein
MVDRATHSARAKRALVVARKRPRADAEPLIERIVFRCIVGLAVASVAAVLFLSVVGASP